ncbi:MAG: hypothetical protein K0U39_06270 [Alphaproteobacteria bacterium]|nr:hypothetical protein [Alphaproteobacteria bacterium]
MSPKQFHSQKPVNHVAVLDSNISLDVLSEKLAQSQKISQLATQYPRTTPAATADKLIISSELLQNLILKLLLADEQGEGLKPTDTVHLARALKEIAALHDKLPNADKQQAGNEEQTVNQAMRMLGLLGADTLKKASKKSNTPKSSKNNKNAPIEVTPS